MKQQVDPLDVIAAYAPRTPVDVDILVLARARIERDMAATPLNGPTKSAPAWSGRPRPGVQRRWIASVAVVGALAVVGVVAPSLSSPEAFASWTPTPTVLSGEEAQAVGQRCIDSMSGGPGGNGWPETDEWDAFTTLLAERRGDLTFSLVGSDGWIANCLATADSSGGSIEEFDDSGVAADSVDLRSIGGSERDGAIFSYTYGRAGAEVAAVDIMLTSGEVVEAAVVDGRYAAWWPGHPRDDATVTLHLVDGTTRGPFPIESTAFGSDA